MLIHQYITRCKCIFKFMNTLCRKDILLILPHIMIQTSSAKGFLLSCIRPKSLKSLIACKVRLDSAMPTFGTFVSSMTIKSDICAFESRDKWKRHASTLIIIFCSCCYKVFTSSYNISICAWPIWTYEGENT